MISLVKDLPLNGSHNLFLVINFGDIASIFNQAAPELLLTVLPSNSESSCIALMRAGVVGIHYHA